MKIILYGASGKIGQRILNEALNRGHVVTAVAKDANKIKTAENLNTVNSDILNQSSVSKLVKGYDAVISAFGPGDTDPKNVIKAARALINGLKLAAVKRVLIVGGAGSLQTTDGKTVIDSPDFPIAWKPIAKAHAEALEVFKTEGNELDWSVFSPAAYIEPGERTGLFRLGDDNLVSDNEGKSRISMEDYALAMIDELEKSAHLKRRFTAAY